jgi:ribosome biogenesis GTPase A
MKGKESKPHIGIFGRRNNGKSSILNALTGQETAIVSEQAGTTTDPVKKTLEIDKNGIATGDTTEDKKQRKRFIMDFYKVWETENPQKRVFNKSLNDFINVRYVSVDETMGHASYKYTSTLAVTFLTEILEKATQKGTSKNANPEKKSQRGFEKLITMEYQKAAFGTIKLTVGVKRGTKEKIQYCVTAIENG